MPKTLLLNCLLDREAYGMMMTRTLAENYPYSNLYKAALRGARKEWLEIVDCIERGDMNPTSALKHTLVLLRNKSDDFEKAARIALQNTKKLLSKKIDFEYIFNFILNYVETSTYSARLFEIAIHSVMQVLEDKNAIDGYLKPLCQMRSANKKHGNIGDIEIIAEPKSMSILEAWDAKFGKPYLRDELEEVHEKLLEHTEARIIGFIVDSKPNLKTEIKRRIKELQAIHDIELHVIDMKSWAIMQLEACGEDSNGLAAEWLLAFVESICQMRRDRAPIDEPSDVWVAELISKLQAAV